MTGPESSATKGPLPLCAGPLSLLFDDGGLRYIRLRDTEVVRRVYSAVRDENWGTVPARIRNLEISRTDDAFRIEFDAEHVQAEIDFTWHGLIRGDASGRIVFEMDGVAKSDFRKNRIGFCILHPMSLAGQRLTVLHADGSRDETNSRAGSRRTTHS
jgi:hypothetical protein